MRVHTSRMDTGVCAPRSAPPVEGQLMSHVLEMVEKIMWVKMRWAGLGGNAAQEHVGRTSNLGEADWEWDWEGGRRWACWGIKAGFKQSITRRWHWRGADAVTHEM